MEKQNDVFEIDLLKLIQVLWRKAWIIVLVSVFAAAVALAGTVYFITPEYTASVLMYVNNSSINLGGGSVSISSGDISAAKSLVATYAVILKTRLTLEEVIDVAQVPYSYETLNSMVSAGAENSTEIFRVKVVDTDPYEACVIANSIAKVLPGKVEQVVDGASVRVVDYAVVPQSQSSPSYTKNTAIGFVIGFVAICAVIVLKEIFEDTIKSDDWLIENFEGEIPLLATIPEEGNHGKYGKYYKAYRKNYYSHRDRYGYYQSSSEKKATGTDDASAEKKKASDVDPVKPTPVYEMKIGPKLDFAATEAYNLLRTNLIFTIPNKETARVISITSPNPAEGKSYCAINLAYSLAASGKKTLLIDCDLRKPTVSKRLNVKAKPGLSDALVDPACLTINKGVLAKKLDVLTSGSIPPNPSELVGSDVMRRLVAKMSEFYNFIIIDLPPVNTVADALSVAQLSDGIVTVVRHSFTRRSEVNEAMRQLELAKVNVLGFVYNAYRSDSKHYHYINHNYRRYGYSHYGSKYGYYSKYGYNNYYQYRSHDYSQPQPQSQEPRPEDKQ